MIGVWTSALQLILAFHDTAPLNVNGVNVNITGDTFYVMHSTYKEFQEKYSHRGYDQTFLIRTSLMEVLDKDIAHVFIQVFKLLSVVKSISNNRLCSFLFEIQFYQ